MADLEVYDPYGSNRKKSGQRSARIPDDDDAESVDTEEIPNQEPEYDNRNRGPFTPSESESAADSGDVGDGDNPFSWKQPETDFNDYKGKKRGPKPIEINWTEFDKLCKLQCTLEEIAGWFGVSPDKIEYSVKQKWKIKFSEYFKVKSAGGKIAIRRALMQKVNQGNTAVILYMAKSKLKEYDTPDKDPKLLPGDAIPGDETKKEKEPDTYTINYLGPAEDENCIVELEDDLNDNAG